MADRMKLVQGDTRPPVIVQLSDDNGPVDLSAVGTVVRMYFREEGTTTILATIVGSKLTGYAPDPENDPTTVIQTAPYNVAGFGGRVQFSWVGSTALSNEAGNYEGEVEVTFADGSVQTGWDLLKFRLREQF